MRIGSTHTASVIVVICIAVGIAGYLMYRPAAPPMPVEPPAAAPAAPVIGKFIAISPPLPAPDIAYRDHDGAARHLASFRGHWVLINLWATWCAPCIAEMPSLDRLRAKVGDALAVVAISEDRKGAAVVDPFVAEHAIKLPTIGFDPTGDVAGAFHVDGLPTSFLIDPQGRMVAKLQGAAQWDGGATLARLKALMAAR